jgi:hypothetical protein
MPHPEPNLPPLPKPDLVHPKRELNPNLQANASQAPLWSYSDARLLAWGQEVRRMALAEAADKCLDQAQRWEDNRAEYIATECSLAIRTLIENPAEVRT